MVVGSKLVWAHLPKAAGDTTLALFQLFPEFVEYADPADTNLKHAKFSDRPRRVAGRARALNFRRLPAWVLSFTLHRTTKGVHPEYTPLPMHSPRLMSTMNVPDLHLRGFTDDGLRLPEHWLRVEALADDFLSLMGRFTSVSDKHRRAVHELAPRNASKYERELTAWFTAKHIERMYASNPLWAEVERAVYGDTLLDGWQDD